MSQTNETEAELDEFLASLKSEAPAAEVSAQSELVTTASPVEVEAEVAEFLDTMEASSATVEDDTRSSPPDDGGDDPAAFMANVGLRSERDVPDIMKPWMQYHKFTRVMTLAEVNRIVDEMITRGFGSLDLETEGLDNRIFYDAEGKPHTVHKIVGFCLSYDGEEGFYVPIRHRPTDGGPDLNVQPVAEVEAAIRRLCLVAIPEGTTPEAIAKDPLSYEITKPPRVVLCFWNAQFDHEFLYPITGIDWWHPSSFEDGMLACFVKYAGDKGIGLKTKSKQLLRDPKGNPYEMIELKELFPRGAKIEFAKLAPDEPGVLRYAGSDAICTYKICRLPEYVPMCLEKYGFTYRLEKQTSNALRVMERNRTKINRKNVRELLSTQEAKRRTLLDKIQKFARDHKGVDQLDPNSPKQLSGFLFGTGPSEMDISPKPEKNVASGQYKTDGDTLEELAALPNAAPILKDIVAFRGVEKTIGTYLLGLANNPDQNDELRFSFKQTGAGTGRLSAPAGDPDHGYSGIPIHGIPSGSDLRRSFEARQGYAMVKADYAGEELRIAANVSKEPVWIREFLEGSGDLHTITARAFFGKQEVSKEERGAGKIANFSLLYGGGPKAIVRATGCSDMEARRRKQAFDKAVPVFAKWIKSQHAIVKRDLGVTTPFNRWLPIPDANHVDQAIRASCERHSVNYVIQGAGADIMKISLVLLHKAFHMKGWLKNGGDDSIRMLLTVHDEVVFEIRYDRVTEAIPLIVDKMESPWRMPKTSPWKVPLVVEPLVGFNWSSGYKCERAKKDGHVGKDEFLRNGFVYSVTRKPAKETETLDIGEVADGKMYRLAEIPPWLLGEDQVAPQIEQLVSTVAPRPVTAPETPKEVELEAQPKSTPLPLISTAPAAEIKLKIDNTARVTKLSINQLNSQTAEQVFDFVWNAMENDGPVLHLTDIVGTTLIRPELGLRVNEDKLMERLRRFNLLYHEA